MKEDNRTLEELEKAYLSSESVEEFDRILHKAAKKNMSIEINGTSGTVYSIDGEKYTDAEEIDLSTVVYIDGKKSSKKALGNIPSGKIASMTVCKQGSKDGKNNLTVIKVETKK